MTEEEATTELIRLTKEYMKNPPEVRKELYSEYQQNRIRIKEQLISFVTERKQLEIDNKIIR